MTEERNISLGEAVRRRTYDSILRYRVGVNFLHSRRARKSGGISVKADMTIMGDRRR